MQARPTGLRDCTCRRQFFSSKRTPVGALSSACRSTIAEPVSPFSTMTLSTAGSPSVTVFLSAHEYTVMAPRRSSA
jgi:hypothetical protein